jgi:hypothetical protein
LTLKKPQKRQILRKVKSFWCQIPFRIPAKALPEYLVTIPVRDPEVRLLAVVQLRNANSRNFGSAGSQKYWKKWPLKMIAGVSRRQHRY